MLPLSLLLSYRRTGKHALHVLVGALETVPELVELPILRGGKQRDLVALIRERLAAGDARVLVAWSFYSPDFAPMRALLAQVRAEVEDPRVLHIAGGVHASAEPAQTLRAGWDLVAVGEGERLIIELVEALRRGEDPAGVQGVATLRGGRYCANGRGASSALDDYPPFALGRGLLGPIEITRGCIYACSFCQTPFFHKARFRHRSVGNVTHYVRELVGRGFRDYRFISPTSLSYGSQGPQPDLAALEELLAAVRAAIGPQRRLFYGTFPSELRPEHVSPEALALLRRYVDNDNLIIGAQSGSERVLAHSRRGHGVAVIERAVRLCLEAEFRPHVDFIFGLPGETPAEREASLRLAESLADLGARVHGHTFMPLPGTPFRHEAPGVLPAPTRGRLLRLASRGGLYGQWEHQEGIARELAAERSPGT